MRFMAYLVSCSDSSESAEKRKEIDSFDSTLRRTACGHSGAPHSEWAADRPAQCIDQCIDQAAAQLRRNPVFPHSTG
jgi:hypothetical protein